MFYFEREMNNKRIMWVCITLIILGCSNICGAKELAAGWTKRAAEEAEDVAAISCSGHGKAYLDGLVKDSKAVCECNNCWVGPDCSQFNESCSADVALGDSVFLEPFWVDHASSTAVVTSGWHRMSYRFPDGGYISRQLELHIRKLHATVKNAVTEGRYILYGAGATQLISASVFALSKNVTTQASVVADIPFYPTFKTQTDYFETARFRFELNQSQVNASAPVIKFITIPNNPDGNLTSTTHAHLPNVYPVHDLVYYWPQHTPITHPFDEDLMLFTASKLTGHSGSRFGWAIVKDKTTYDNMLEFMSRASVGTSRDTQLRMLNIFKTMLQGNGREMFNVATKKMIRRWEIFNSVMAKSDRFKLQQIPSAFCTFYNRYREATPAYAWVKCVRKEDSNCFKVFADAKITGNPGSDYYADDSYVRIALIRAQNDFDQLIQRLKVLVGVETSGSKIMNQ